MNELLCVAGAIMGIVIILAYINEKKSTRELNEITTDMDSHIEKYRDYYEKARLERGVRSLKCWINTYESQIVKLGKELLKAAVHIKNTKAIYNDIITDDCDKTAVSLYITKLENDYAMIQQNITSNQNNRFAHQECYDEHNDVLLTLPIYDNIAIEKEYKELRNSTKWRGNYNYVKKYEWYDKINEYSI